jgi:hypothetical protein
LEVISSSETKKLTEFTNGYFKTEEPVIKKIKKNVEKINYTENSNEDEDSYCYLVKNSCPKVVQDRSFEQMNGNFSLPNRELFKLFLCQEIVL